MSELRLEDDVIDVQIAWATPAFDGKPPAPYGDRAFDEYGVPDMGFWYPREIPGFGCPPGGDGRARAGVVRRGAGAARGPGAAAGVVLVQHGVLERAGRGLEPGGAVGSTRLQTPMA